uniref:AT-hook motif nuclear-localized protein n=1 Tax=Tanacetum cinerariifolium TaxID=118510 RepID=A0A6L2KIY5_TANCI|nr:AT-hook motif nuclear-localized protein 1-like [Tanacetum cinerariifolium]
MLREHVQEPRDTEPIPITIVKPTVTSSETKIIRSSSRIQLTDPIVEVQVPQPESPYTTPKPNRGKGIARDTNESQPKLIKALMKVCSDPDTSVLIPFEINGKLYHITNQEIQARMELEERKQKVAHEARLLALSKPELIKVVTEVVTEARVDPNTLQSIKGGQEFIKIQDAKIKVLNKEHSENLKKEKKLRKKRIEHYKRNFNVQKPFRFGDFGVTKWDELGAVIPKKKNKVVEDMITSLQKKYKRLRVIPREIRISPSLLAPKQVPSLSRGIKRKAQELEPKVHISGLECNRILPEGMQFVNNQVIKHPENEIFFIDVFGEEAFQRTSNIYKVDVDTLMRYMAMASNINTPTNQSSKKSGKRKRHGKGALNFTVVGVVDYEMLKERLMHFHQNTYLWRDFKDTYKMDEDELSMHFEEAHTIILFDHDPENKEDVTSKIISFSKYGPFPICVLSVLGIISHVTLLQASSSGGTMTYEGRFEILLLSETFTPSESGGVTSREGGMSIIYQDLMAVSLVVYLMWRLQCFVTYTPAFSVQKKEIWNGFRRDINDDRDFILTMKRTKNTLRPRLEEWIDFEESFAPVARLEAIRIFLAYAA